MKKKREVPVLYYVEPMNTTDIERLCLELGVSEDEVGIIPCNDGLPHEMMVQISTERYEALRADPEDRECFTFWRRVNGKPAMPHDEAEAALRCSTVKEHTARKRLRDMIRLNGGKRKVQRALLKRVASGR